MVKFKQLLGDRILVLPDEAKKATSGGILLPDTAVDRPKTGTVVAVGPGARREHGPSGQVTYYYEAGNAKSEDEVRKACSSSAHHNILLMPSTREKAGTYLDGGRHPMTVKVGDRVMYTIYSNANVEVEGYAQPLVLMREEEAIGVIE